MRHHDRAVLRRAGYLDQELTHVLNNGVLSGELARMDAPDLETAAQDGDNWRKPDVYPPPEGKGTPDLNSAYWNSLSPSEKLKVILGTRNGSTIEMASRPTPAMRPIAFCCLATWPSGSASSETPKLNSSASSQSMRTRGCRVIRPRN